MLDIEEHYSQLLGINSPWEIFQVKLEVNEHRVDIDIEYTDVEGQCPECHAVCPRHDVREKRNWRHLDTMQFATYLHCEVPRIRCERHGVKTVTVPWAGKHSRFTLLFEGFAIQVLQAARSVEEARKLLGLNWHQVDRLKARAVDRGLTRRKAVEIPYIGIDEKQFQSGHRYVSSLVDLGKGRVIDVVEDRTEAACQTLLEQALSKRQRTRVKAVAMDMWLAYTNAVTETLPQAAIVHDRFHISKHLNEAVDKVRRQEHKALRQAGDECLTGSKYFWLSNEENQKEETQASFGHLRHSTLKVARAWALKEHFRDFWTYTYTGCAKRYFDHWYAWAIRSRLTPMKEKARMLKDHLSHILTYFTFPISNAVAEGLNSKIQTIKANARGYRSFDGFRNSILFYCGGLDMAP